MQYPPVTVTTPGTGYTFAYIRVADIVSAGATGLTGTELDVIIEPKGGHGKDAVDELGGFFVMTNTNFEGRNIKLCDFNTTNDFRRVSIIKDPNSGGSGAATTLRGVKAILLSGSPGSFTVDEKITQGFQLVQ